MCLPVSPYPQLLLRSFVVETNEVFAIGYEDVVAFVHWCHRKLTLARYYVTTLETTRVAQLETTTRDFFTTFAVDFEHTRHPMC